MSSLRTVNGRLRVVAGTPAPQAVYDLAVLAGVPTNSLRRLSRHAPFDGVLIRPAYLATFVTAIAGQQSFLDWLSRRLVLSTFRYGVGSVGCVLARDVVTSCSLITNYSLGATRTIAAYANMGPSPNEVGPGAAGGGSTAFAYDLIMVNSAPPDKPAVMEPFLWSVKPEASAQIRTEYLFGSDSAPFGYGGTVSGGGTPTSSLPYAQQHQLVYNTPVTFTATPTPPPATEAERIADCSGWILISGPAVCDRAEWIELDATAEQLPCYAASAALSVASAVERLRQATKDGNEQARLTLQINNLKAKPNTVYVTFRVTSTNPFLLYPPTRKNAAELWGLSGVKGGYNFTLAHEQAVTAKGRMLTTAVPDKGLVPPDVASAHFGLSSGATVSFEAYPLLPEGYVLLVRKQGELDRTFTYDTPEALAAAVALITRLGYSVSGSVRPSHTTAYQTALQDESGPIEDTFATNLEDRAGLGMATISTLGLPIKEKDQTVTAALFVTAGGGTHTSGVSP